MALTEKQQEALHAWVDDEATPAQRREITRLLNDRRDGDDAQAYLAEIRRLREPPSAPPIPLPPSLHGRVIAALDAEFGCKKRSMLYTIAVVAVAATVLGAVLGPALLGTSDEPAAISNVRAVSAPSTGTGNDKEVRLVVKNARPPTGVCADLLLIGFVYGEADLIDAPACVEVDVTHRRLPALVSAIDVMVERQGYGRLEAPPELLADARRHRRQTPGRNFITHVPPRPPGGEPKIKLRIYLR